MNWRHETCETELQDLWVPLSRPEGHIEIGHPDCADVPILKQLEIKLQISKGQSIRPALNLRLIFVTETRFVLMSTAAIFHFQSGPREKYSLACTASWWQLANNFLTTEVESLPSPPPTPVNIHTYSIAFLLQLIQIWTNWLGMNILMNCSSYSSLLS